MTGLDPTVIGAVFTGLTGLIAGLAAYTASRQRRVAEDQRVLRRQVRTLQKQLVVTLEHIFALELSMAQHGLPVPDRPKILERPADDDDEPATLTPPAPAASAPRAATPEPDRADPPPDRAADRGRGRHARP